MNNEYRLSEQDEIELQEMENEHRCGEIAAEINAIRRTTLRTLLEASVEIGKLLVEAKGKLPHGAWGDWLLENFEYSQTTANNLMRLYYNYGEKDQIDLFGKNLMEVFGGLTPSQALALLPLPAEEREAFVESHDMEKTSVRDIEAEIRARKDAEARADAAEKEAERAQIELKELSGLEDELNGQIDERDRKIADLEKKLADASDPKAQKAAEKDLRKKIEEKVRKEAADEKTRLEKALTEAQKAAGENDAKIAEAEKKARDAAAAEYIGKLLELENRAREAEARATKGADGDVQRFAVLFEQFQGLWKEMRGIVVKIGQNGDGETAAKLAHALKAVVTDMAEEL